MNLRQALSIFAVFALVAACGQDATEPPPPVNTEPVVVFAAGVDRAYLAGLFAGYTRATGVQVVLRTGAMEQLVADVITNRVDPPADLLWVSDVAALHDAAEEGALRPIRSDSVDAAVPQQLRDPDSFWTAISYRLAVIALAPGSAVTAGPVGYGSLAAERFVGTLCLGSIENPLNRAVIGVMIEELGMRRAETAVRTWIRSLAREVYSDDARLVTAIASGDCPVGIVPSDVLLGAVREGHADGVGAVLPDVIALQAEGIGIGRHARNPDGALTLLEWLMRDDIVAGHAASRGTYPANRDAALPAGLMPHTDVELPSLSALAFGSQDARRLAERASYRD